MARRSRFVLIAGCFFLSGAAGLLYEVAWTRFLGLLFGHTTHAVTAVLAAYMGGLALGSVLLGRWADRVRRPLRAYGLVEVAIALWCAATPALFRLLDAAYGALSARLQASAAAQVAIHFLFAAVVLLPPTALMGATLPLLSRTAAGEQGRAGARIGTLYAINIWGAVAGVLATGFVLLPAIGLRATVWLGVLLDLLVGGVAVWLDRETAAVPAAAASPVPEAAPPAGARERLAVRVALAAVGVTGAASMAYEIAWTRALALILGSSTYAFSAMLATFLAGLALGAAIAAAVLRRRPVGLAAFGVAGTLAALGAVLVLPLFGLLPALVLAVLGKLGLEPRAALAASFAASAVTMLPAAVLVGTTLPLLLGSQVDRTPMVGASVGRVYGANTIGTIAGAAVTGLVLLPALGIQRTVVAASAASMAASLAVLAVLQRRTAGARLVAAGAAVALAAAAVATPPWDRRILTAGTAVYARSYLRGTPGSDLATSAHRGALLFYEEGVNTTVSVTRTDHAVALAVNGKVDASSGVDMLTQLLLGHLPALLAPGARSAFVVGLGSGVTAGALAQHPLESIEVAELEPAVARAAAFFQRENRGVLGDPRLRLVTGDGRQILATGRRRWDIIVSEPSNPWIAGVANLFTREFYEAARRALAPGGVVVQWLQGYSLFERDLRMVAATFRSVFPHATLWRSVHGDYLLVASDRPLEVDLPAVRRRLASSEGAWADLARFQLDADGLLGQFVLDEEGVAAFAAGSSVHEDDRPVLEFDAPLALWADTDERNDVAIRAARRGELPRLRGADPRDHLTPAGRLRLARGHRLRGNPAEAIHQLGAMGEVLAPGERLERARLGISLGLLREASADLQVLRAEGREGPAVERYVRVIRALGQVLPPDALARASQPHGTGSAAEVLDRVGSILLGAGIRAGEPALYEFAAEQYQAALRFEPDAVNVENNLANCWFEMGRLDEAIAIYRRFSAAHPGAQGPFNLGMALERKGLATEALDAYLEATRRDSTFVPAREALVRLGAR